MVRTPNTGLTEGEERFMRVLWDKGEASVREVANTLSLDKPTAYNTALTMLRILHDKGAVGYRQEGRAFIYRAELTQEKARSNALSRLIGALFNGSSAELAAHLVKKEGLDAESIAALRDELDKAAQRGADPS